MANKKLSVAKTLRANGTLGTLKTYTSGAGAYNPGTGTLAARGDETADSTRAVMLLDQLTSTPSRSYGGAGVTEAVNTMVEGVEKWCLMDATSREPRIQDHVIVGSDEWRILNVQTMSDKSGPVMYVLALRR